LLAIGETLVASASLNSQEMIDSQVLKYIRVM